MTVVNDCYNANPMSMRAALDDLAARRRSAASRCSATWPSWARESGASTARSASTRRELGVDVLVTVGEGRSRSSRASRRETYAVATPEEAGALLEELPSRATVCWSRGRAPWAWSECSPRTDMLGTILIAGMGSLFICMFLGPRFIEFLREREFGQQIREEGPVGHAAKAGTPTMGGLLIMVSVVVPFLILGQFDTETLAVFGTCWRARRLASPTTG